LPMPAGPFNAKFAEPKGTRSKNAHKHASSLSRPRTTVVVPSANSYKDKGYGRGTQARTRGQVLFLWGQEHGAREFLTVVKCFAAEFTEHLFDGFIV
jgi:hypothetical protein